MAESTAPAAIEAGAKVLVVTPFKADRVLDAVGKAPA